jgi:hypothetical protein
MHVSPLEQSLDLQTDALNHAAREKRFIDKASSAYDDDRPGLIRHSHTSEMIFGFEGLGEVGRSCGLKRWES